MDTQQLVTWPQLAVMVYNLKRMAKCSRNHKTGGGPGIESLT